MALQTIRSDLLFPARLTTPQASGPSFTSNLVNANTKKHAFILQAPKTGNIHKILIRTNTAATGATFDVRLETVDPANGDPSGTLWGTNTNASVNFNAANTVFTATLTADAAVTQGDLFAVNLVTAAGSVSVSFCMFNDVLSHLPYTDFFSASWGKASSAPVVGIEYDDGTYHCMPGAFPFSALNTNTYNSGSTPDERGLKFQMPFPCVVSGFWIDMDNDNDMTMNLYDSDGTTVLKSLAIDKDIRGTTNYGVQMYRFASTQNLLANTYYRLVCTPGASNITTADFDVPSAAAMDQVGGGQLFHHTQRTDAGAWTDTTTKRPFMGLIITGFDDGVQQGSLVHRRRKAFVTQYWQRPRRAQLSQSVVVQNVTNVMRRKTIHTPPAVITKRRPLALSFPNVIQVTSIPINRRRRVSVYPVTQILKHRHVVSVTQLFQSLYVRRVKRFTPAPQFARTRRPVVPQAAVTVTQNVIVHRRRHVHHRYEAFIRREQTILAPTHVIPRRRRHFNIPPEVVVRKRRTQITLQTLNTNLVVSRARKVR